jgi:preprotein translocase subunit SecD
MNRYPLWKYIVIALAIIVSALYAVPNLFGEVPAVQVAGTRASFKVDDALRTKLQDALKAANVNVTETEQEGDAVRFRVADTDTQLRARDVLQKNVSNGFVVALNLVPNSPHWLQAIGAKPMYLGLDLRGGVHFLLQVDMAAAKKKFVERYLSDVRTNLRDKKIYYTGLAREGEERIVVRFREADQKAAAVKLLAEQMPDLAVREQDIGGESALIATIKPEVVKRDAETTVQQNIQTLRNRVNELGVAEPIVQQQGPGPHRRAAGRRAGPGAREGDPRPHRDPGSAQRRRGAGLRHGPRRFVQYKEQAAPFGTDKFFDQEGNAVLVKKNVVITGDRIKDAQPGFDQQNGGRRRAHVPRRHGRADHARQHAREREEAHGDDAGGAQQHDGADLARDPGGIRRALPDLRHARRAGGEEPGAAAARRRAGRAHGHHRGAHHRAEPGRREHPEGLPRGDVGLRRHRRLHDPVLHDVRPDLGAGARVQPALPGRDPVDDAGHAHAARASRPSRSRWAWRSTPTC